jgi:hypothetical protein
MAITDRLQDGNPNDAPGDLDGVVNSLQETVTRTNDPEKDKLDPNDQQATAQNSNQNVERPEWIESKFWTGDIEESMEKQAKSYRELHSAYGRMANDLGTQRKITDQLLLGKRDADMASGSAAPTKEPPKVDSAKLIDNPTETLDEYWKDREASLRSEWETEQRQRGMVAEEQAFLVKHPNFREVASTPEFEAWMTSSPLRLRAAQLAGQGDYTVADELFTEYSALQGGAPAPVTRDEDGNNVVETGDDTEAAKRVATESAANAPSTGGNSGGKPIYRRADLIALKQNRPGVYADPQFQEEILQAYAEGRVK